MNQAPGITGLGILPRGLYNEENVVSDTIRMDDQTDLVSEALV